MSFKEARNVEVGTIVYKKSKVNDRLMRIIKKRVIRKDPTHANWYNEVLFLCDDGEEYLHTDLFCYK